MKVLDIYPDGCWSFRGLNQQTIQKLRAAVLIANESDRELALSHIPEGEAFRFVGDPVKFEFAPRFFDKINLMFAPDATRRAPLRQCISRWSKNPIQFPDQSQAENAPAATLEGPPLSRCLAKLLPSWAS